MTRLTKRQRELRRKYTEIRRVNGGFAAVLHVGVQSFKMLEATRESARFFRDMMAVALNDILVREGVSDD